jgi:Flp pilus assembly protein TadB
MGKTFNNFFFLYNASVKMGSNQRINILHLLMVVLAALTVVLAALTVVLGVITVAAVLVTLLPPVLLLTFAITKEREN